jgi:hypothetical protein
MPGLIERVTGAWDVLRGLKKATVRPPVQTRRIGTDPSASDEDILSAAFTYFKNYTHLEPDRVSIYSDMDEMFQYVLAHAALEAYLEDATQPDLSSGLTVWPEADNPEIQAELIRLFENMEIENRIIGDMWGMCKYGDHFPLLRYDKKTGIHDAIPIDPRIVERVEGNDRVLRGFHVGEVSVGDSTTSAKQTRFKPWDMAHFRVHGKRPTDKYGTPFFIQVRLIYKVLKLMEEQMTIYRMNLHPDRLVFKVFTGSAGVDERRRAVRQWRRELSKVASFNHDTGRFTSEYAPWMVNQDIFWPVGANDTQSGVDKFAGSANSGDIFDVEYMRDLFFSGTRVPKGYMGFEDSQGYRGTDTLSAQSIKFARGVRRIQRDYLQGMTRMCKIHLALRGKDPSHPDHSFSLKTTPTSYLDEAHKAELYAKRFEAVSFMLDIGTKMSESFENKFNTQTWATYVLKEFGHFDDGMISKLLTPVPTGGADMTYTPQGAAFRFENMSNDEMKKLRDMINENDDLKKILSTVLPSAELDFQSKWHSRLDPIKLTEARDATFDSDAFDKALKANDTKIENLGEERRQRLHDEIKSIVEAVQEQNKE